MPAPTLESIIRHLWPPETRDTRTEVYAILDGARNEAIYPAVTGSRMLHSCLYRVPLPPVLAEAAPYIVQLIPNTPFTSWLLREGWGESWGIFLSSTASLQRLRRHFRRFLMVKDDTGRTIYFRFYDPRVLRMYLPTCTKAEREYVFGPVECFHAEAEDAASMVDYARSDFGLTSASSRPEAARAMLVIRDAQMEALRAAVGKALEQRIIAELKSSDSTILERYTEKQLGTLVEAGVKESARYGYLSETDVHRFVACSARHGIGFVTKEPWAVAISNDPDLTPAQRLQRFEDHASG